jgi:VanZ family protein
LTIFLCALVGLMTELLQFTGPQRMFDVMDMFVDVSGAFAGSILYISIARLPASGRPDAGSLTETDDA